MARIKDKERVLKAAREKKVTYKGKPIRLPSDFSTETLQTRRNGLSDHRGTQNSHDKGAKEGNTKTHNN